MSEAPRKFAFDTEFDAAGGVAFEAPRPKRSYTPEEVEAIRGEAYAEGQRNGLGGVAAQQARAVAEIAAICNQAMPRLAQVAHEHREGSAALALACAKAIAGAALERFPEAPLLAALEVLAHEIESAPRLIVNAPEAFAEPINELLNQTVARMGYGGAIQVRADAAMPPNAFTLDFGDGAASFDPAAAAERVADALNAALAAEGLHAEPLIPG